MFLSVTTSTLPLSPATVINMPFYCVPRCYSKYLTYINAFKSHNSLDVSTIIFHLIDEETWTQVKKGGKVSV